MVVLMLLSPPERGRLLYTVSRFGPSVLMLTAAYSVRRG